ncbi:DUF5701 family protein [Ornithinimicrobium kibberense]|uniref:DUF5701 family protein n=1 Tax=Ornithinimicrobium kibberense TaxID=282060 RepID=A0ABV5V373_9MICO|nr:DUF5701 family protein [Ornithinimicrobium kibberense]
MPRPADTRPADTPTAPTVPALPPVADQAERLVALGVHELAGLPAEELRAEAARLAADLPGPGHPRGPGQQAEALLVVSSRLVPPSALAPLMRLPVRGGERSGFVVEDMTDVDDFAPVDGIEVPEGPLYLVLSPDRGDDLANWSPEEALPELARRGRSPLLLAEGVHWALQAPGVVADNHCYMTIGSRRRKDDGRLDSRTPAVWISRGTGRDGRERRGAPKVGWCWAGNRHTWLGFASATGRRG